MKYCLFVMLCVCAIGNENARAQDDPEGTEPTPEWNPSGTVVVSVTNIQCLKTGDQISASASFSATTTETAAAVMYTLHIREYPAYSTGSMLAGGWIWHSNLGGSTVPANVTQSWTSAITNEYVYEFGSYVGEADIHGVPDGGGNSDSEPDAAYDDGGPA